MREMPLAAVDPNIEKRRPEGAGNAVIRRAASETVDIMCGRPFSSVDSQLTRRKTGFEVAINVFPERVVPEQLNLEHDVILLTANQPEAFPFTTCKNKHPNHRRHAAALTSQLNRWAAS